MSASGLPGGGPDCGAGRSGCRGTCGLRKPGPRRRRIACRGGGTRARLKLWGDSHACADRRAAVSDTVRHCSSSATDPKLAAAFQTRGIWNAAFQNRCIWNTSRHASLGALGGAFCGWWQRGAFPLRPGVARHQSRSRRDRGSVASFSINGTLRGADVITDHGAEYVVLAQGLPASLTPPHVVSIFSFIRTFLCFLGSPSSAAPEKKKEEKRRRKRKKGEKEKNRSE